MYHVDLQKTELLYMNILKMEIRHVQSQKLQEQYIVFLKEINNIYNNKNTNNNNNHNNNNHNKIYI